VATGGRLKPTEPLLLAPRAASTVQVRLERVGHIDRSRWLDEFPEANRLVRTSLGMAPESTVGLPHPCRIGTRRARFWKLVSIFLHIDLYGNIIIYIITKSGSSGDGRWVGGRTGRSGGSLTTLVFGEHAPRWGGAVLRGKSALRAGSASWRKLCIKVCRGERRNALSARTHRAFARSRRASENSERAVAWRQEPAVEK